VLYHEWVIEAQRRSRRDKISIPIIPASTYRDREKKLKASGILDWERAWLVAHRLDTPGMKEMLRARKEVYNRAKDNEMSMLEYRKEISKWYRKRGWEFNNGTLNPFDMLEFYRDRIADEKEKWPYGKKTPKIKKDYVAAKAKMIKRKEETSTAHWLFKPRIRPI
jgi:hypothetical protein